MFDVLIQRAQQRRMILLREISIRRELARRAEEAPRRPSRQVSERAQNYVAKRME
jgi:hypothetical protein